MGACASDDPPADFLEAGEDMDSLEASQATGWSRRPSTDTTFTAGMVGILECPNAVRWCRRTSNSTESTAACESVYSGSDTDSEYDGQLALEDLYDVDVDPIGEGSYGSVHKCKYIQTGSVRAVKKIRKGLVDDIKELGQEMETLKMMSHPNVIMLLETFQDTENMSLVTELCEGGDLFEQVVASGHLSESQAASAMQQIFHATSYVHECNIIHRDLKPDNFLLLTTDPIEQNTVKLVDFGLSCRSELGAVHTEVVGTPHYMAPEVFNRQYDRRCDLWSCGVVLYVLLSGRTPFGGHYPEDIRRRVCHDHYSFRGNVWEKVSDGARDLIGRLMEKDTERRLTSEEASRHDWVVTMPPRRSHVEQEDLSKATGQDWPKKAVLPASAWNSDEAQTQQLRETFDKLDRSGRSALHLQDLSVVLNEAASNAPAEDLDASLRKLDAGISGAFVS
uniref:non-specific serine/threonine protein kinase n=1 Tax=Alexandrium catenella TaxID=2925 RepID=A0A7S1MDK3_ALECA|mmetsp:Transcript_2460/g.6619  ORF Transcript_2460/g.6619 Transcript_2460/m.6619 type:complete len:449 (+) Transcript_2460:67-1413(+)